MSKANSQTKTALYREWQEKVFEAQQEMSRLETSTEEVLDDLDQALIIPACAPQPFQRFETRDQNRLLQSLFPVPIRRFI
jgi:hypothetical protein